MLEFESSVEVSNSGIDYNSNNISVINYFFLKNYIISEGAVSHNVLYNLSTALSLLVTKLLYMLTIIWSNYQVSSAFNEIYKLIHLMTLFRTGVM